MIPPDLKQCQADKPTGGPFILGGEIGDPRNGYRIRCRNEPTVIAIENEPGEDGKRGSMSLCDRCKAAAIKQLGESFASFAKLEKRDV